MKLILIPFSLLLLKWTNKSVFRDFSAKCVFGYMQIYVCTRLQIIVSL